MNNNIFAIVKLDTGISINTPVYAQIEDGVQNIDTHSAYDSSKGIYTVPESGIYQIQTQGLNEEGHLQQHQYVRQFKAGDIYNVMEFPLFLGDWVILDRETLCVIEKVVKPGTYEARIVDSVVLPEYDIGKTYTMEIKSGFKRVAPNTNLHTYNLLYDRS